MVRELKILNHCDIIRRMVVHCVWHPFVMFQSALFNFHSFLTVILLGICACTYFKMQFPAILDQKTGYICFHLLPYVNMNGNAYTICAYVDNASLE